MRPGICITCAHTGQQIIRFDKLTSESNLEEALDVIQTAPLTKNNSIASTASV